MHMTSRPDRRSFLRGWFSADDAAVMTPPGVLAEDGRPETTRLAVIGDSCLSLAGVLCRACEDSCESRAIRFRLMTGGRAAPVIATDDCTGCGACSAVCPTAAVRFEVPRPARELSA